MRPLYKIAGINLLILLIYSVVIRFAVGRSGDGSLGIMIFSAIAVGIHVFICLIVAAIMNIGKNSGLGKAWLLSSGLVLLIGFSVCLGNTAL